MAIGPTFSDHVTHETLRYRHTSQKGSGFHSIVRLLPVVLLFVVTLLFLGRLFFLQIVHGEYYSQLSNINRTRTDVVYAPRGVIFDKDGNALTSNSPSFKVVSEKEQEDTDYSVDVEWVSQEDALALEAKGATVAADVQRTYLYGPEFAHVLGYIGQVTSEDLAKREFEDYGIADFTGKEGLEYTYEKLLHGVNGRELYEVDNMGNVVRLLGRDDPVSGDNLHTTLDLKLQLAVAHAMQGVERGSVVAIDPHNGAVRALFSAPSYDVNLFTRGQEYSAKGEFKTIEDVFTGENRPLLNRAIAGQYPPGSTYKLVSATAALESGAVTRDTQIEDTGVHRVGDFSFGNWYFLEYGRTDGMVDVVKAVQRSNDIYFYIAAEETGINAIRSWSEKFGLGKPLGIDLPGEIGGVVPSPEWKRDVIGEQWYLGDTYNLGIGQGFLLTTPLQVASWTSVFANDGVLYKPYLKQGGNEVLRENFIEPENIELVREGMRKSCEPGGVAFPLYDFKVKNSDLVPDGLDYTKDASAGAEMVKIAVGCKTGTAETPGDDTDPHAWIAVFAPFYNPEIVITVLVENGGQGSEVAGKIAAEILQKYFEEK